MFILVLSVHLGCGAILGGGQESIRSPTNQWLAHPLMGLTQVSH